MLILVILIIKGNQIGCMYNEFNFHLFLWEFLKERKMEKIQTFVLSKHNETDLLFINQNSCFVMHIWLYNYFYVLAVFI